MLPRSSSIFKALTEPRIRFGLTKTCREQFQKISFSLQKFLDQFCVQIDCCEQESLKEMLGSKTLIPRYIDTNSSFAINFNQRHHELIDFLNSESQKQDTKPKEQMNSILQKSIQCYIDNCFCNSPMIFSYNSQLLIGFVASADFSMEKVLLEIYGNHFSNNLQSYLEYHHICFVVQLEDTSQTETFLLRLEQAIIANKLNPLYLNLMKYLNDFCFFVDSFENIDLNQFQQFLNYNYNFALQSYMLKERTQSYKFYMTKQIQNDEQQQFQHYSYQSKDTSKFSPTIGIKPISTEVTTSYAHIFSGDPKIDDKFVTFQNNFIKSASKFQKQLNIESNISQYFNYFDKKIKSLNLPQLQLFDYYISNIPTFNKEIAIDQLNNFGFNLNDIYYEKSIIDELIRQQISVTKNIVTSIHTDFEAINPDWKQMNRVSTGTGQSLNDQNKQIQDVVSILLKKQIFENPFPIFTQIPGFQCNNADLVKFTSTNQSSCYLFHFFISNKQLPSAFKVALVNQQEEAQSYFQKAVNSFYNALFIYSLFDAFVSSSGKLSVEEMIDLKTNVQKSIPANFRRQQLQLYFMLLESCIQHLQSSFYNLQKALQQKDTLLRVQKHKSFYQLTRSAIGQMLILITFWVLSIRFDQHNMFNFLSDPQHRGSQDYILRNIIQMKFMLNIVLSNQQLNAQLSVPLFSETEYGILMLLFSHILDLEGRIKQSLYYFTLAVNFIQSDRFKLILINKQFQLLSSHFLAVGRLKQSFNLTSITFSRIINTQLSQQLHKFLGFQNQINQFSKILQINHIASSDNYNNFVPQYILYYMQQYFSKSVSKLYDISNNVQHPVLYPITNVICSNQQIFELCQQCGDIQSFQMLIPSTISFVQTKQVMLPHLSSLYNQIQKKNQLVDFLYQEIQDAVGQLGHQLIQQKAHSSDYIATCRQSAIESAMHQFLYQKSLYLRNDKQLCNQDQILLSAIFFDSQIQLPQFIAFNKWQQVYYQYLTKNQIEMIPSFKLQIIQLRENSKIFSSIIQQFDKFIYPNNPFYIQFSMRNRQHANIVLEQIKLVATDNNYREYIIELTDFQKFELIAQQDYAFIQKCDIKEFDPQTIVITTQLLRITYSNLFQQSQKFSCDIEFDQKQVLQVKNVPQITINLHQSAKLQRPFVNISTYLHVDYYYNNEISEQTLTIASDSDEIITLFFNINDHRCLQFQNLYPLTFCNHEKNDHYDDKFMDIAYKIQFKRQISIPLYFYAIPINNKPIQTLRLFCYYFMNGQSRRYIAQYSYQITNICTCSFIKRLITPSTKDLYQQVRQEVMLEMVENLKQLNMVNKLSLSQIQQIQGIKSMHFVLKLDNSSLSSSDRLTLDTELDICEFGSIYGLTKNINEHQFYIVESLLNRSSCQFFNRQCRQFEFCQMQMYSYLRNKNRRFLMKQDEVDSFMESQERANEKAESAMILNLDRPNFYFALVCFCDSYLLFCHE